ncbi:MAG TPA: hypothetical protein ENN97_07710 [Phycisphaerales bacterium]|nr:hypothetical protein [Phycisphaerales bacterium]
MMSMPLANAGTALMWGAAIHLLIGNLLIGFLEGLLLWRIFRVKFLKAAFIMIAANYVSAWAAYMILQGLSAHLYDIVNLYNIQRMLRIGFGAAFVFTVLIELPFVGLLFYKQRRWIFRSIAACLLIHAISYVPLYGWYRLVSAEGVLKNASVLNLSDYVVRNPEAVVYYIGDQSAVYRLRLDGSEVKVIHKLEQQEGKPFLFFNYSENRGEADLNLGWSEGVYMLITQGSECLRESILSDSDIPSLPNEHGMQVTDYRPSEERHWNIEAGFWEMEGLAMRNREGGKWVNIALETPFVQWLVRHVTVLPGDEIIFQFGEQICIFDRESRKLALLAHGSSPVVILKTNDPSERQ